MTLNRCLLSAVELLIANDKIKLMELDKKLDQEIISFGYLKESIEIIAYKHLANIQISIVELEDWYSHAIIQLTFDFDIFGKVAQNFKKQIIKKINDDIHETCYVFDKYGVGYVSVAKLKHPMLSLDE
ncbi:unnamed protein product [Rotaria sordida]|uniref:Uncharacterized protein n=1 Tax=Rotaria sordida TaxID=392033 RepID=A0A813TVB3_9BILA|nr:unnamed protein product [Rotaria sordida]CAF0860006.1 unnamed protein product [Rotaria sordida]CAF1001807.1 unnamed protein product [Rotaria sordida]CAF1085898.1 unnamed protein product [Rotaria sordida]